MSFNIGTVQTTKENAAADVKAATDAVRATDESYGRGGSHELGLSVIEGAVAAFAEKTPDGFAIIVGGNGHANTDGSESVSVNLSSYRPVAQG